MSLNKAIEHNKEYRKEYVGAKSIAKSCRNHGSCDWCRGNREYSYAKKIEATDNEINTYEKGDMKTMNRNLDGYYFRVKRGDRWENVCFSDLTQEEKEFMLAGRSEEWLKSLCCGVADALREIGDELDIVCE